MTIAMTGAMTGATTGATTLVTNAVRAVRFVPLSFANQLAVDS
jgi:hypothetical protein